MSTMLDSYRAEITQLEQMNENQRNTINEKRAYIGQLEQQLRDARETVVDLRRKSDQTIKDLKEADGQVDTLDVKITDLERAIERYRAALTQRDATVQKLEQLYTANHRFMDQQERQLSDVLTKNEELRKENEELRKQIAKYDGDILYCNEVRRREVKIAELEKETVDLREEVNRLNKHISKLGDARVEANNLRRTVDELRQTPSPYQTIVDAHCEKIAELRKEIDCLKASREEALKSLDYFKGQCRRSEDQIRERNLAVSNIKEELETWREHAIKSDKRLHDADTAICGQAEQIESLKKDYDRACSEISKLHNWLNDAEQNLARKTEDRKNAEMARQWSTIKGSIKC